MASMDRQTLLRLRPNLHLIFVRSSAENLFLPVDFFIGVFGTLRKALLFSASFVWWSVLK